MHNDKCPCSAFFLPNKANLLNKQIVTRKKAKKQAKKGSFKRKKLHFELSMWRET